MRVPGAFAGARAGGGGGIGMVRERPLSATQVRAMVVCMLLSGGRW